MFNLQGSEIIIVLLLALVVLGPEKLPDAMRKMGQAYAELKKMSSGFQSEFRAAVDEPLREVRETANVLRDSADFTKLQDGTRQEKPKSGEMAPMAPADPDAVPTDDTPTFDTGPGEAADSKSAPFADEPSEVPRERPSTGPRAFPATPPPFTAMSATPPDVESDSDNTTADNTTDDNTTDDTTTADTTTDDAGRSADGPVPDTDGALPDDEADTTR